MQRHLLTRTTLLTALLLGGCDSAEPIEELSIRSTDICWNDRSCTQHLVVSHKADGVPEPENSIAAIKALAVAGVHAVEVDPRLTSDGHFVLMHDEGIKRTTVSEDNRLVNDMTLAELQTIALKDERCMDAQRQPERCQIPTLAAALDAAKGRIVLVLDVKDFDVDRMAAVLSESNRLSASVIRSIDLDFLDSLVARVPGLITMDWVRTQDDAQASLDDRQPLFIQVEPSDLGAIEPIARAAQSRIMISTLTNVDPYLWAYVDSGAIDQEPVAAQEVELLQDQGLTLFLTSYPVQTLQIINGESLSSAP